MPRYLALTITACAVVFTVCAVCLTTVGVRTMTAVERAAEWQPVNEYMMLNTVTRRLCNAGTRECRPGTMP